MRGNDYPNNTQLDLYRTTVWDRAIVGMAIAAALAALAVATLTGCTQHSDAEATEDFNNQPVSFARAPADLPIVEIDDRNQYALASAIAKIEQLDPFEAHNAYRDLRKAWIGKHYRWRVFLVSATCQHANQCNVLPFDRAGADKSITQGWMPRVDIDAKTHASILRACDGESPCTVELEGTMAELILSTEQFTRMSFSNATLRPIRLASRD